MKVSVELTKALLVLYLFFLVVPLPSKAASILQPVIIDTDAGLDDAIAILYLLKRQDVDVKAITIASDGLTKCDAAFRNISGLLSLMQKTNIPVACGRDTPLQGNHQFPIKWVEHSATLEGAAHLLPKTINPIARNAVDLFIDTITHSSKPVTVLAIGPLTNVAEAIQRNPSIKKNIRSIYIMGGAIHAPGNLNEAPPAKNQTAEWNIYIDPYAADIVLSAKIPVILIPLDITNKMPIDWAFYQKLKPQQHAAANFIYELFKHNEAVIKRKQWYFWDPLAAMLVTDESSATCKNQPIKIQIDTGAMILNKKIGNLVRVCENADKKYFETLLLNTIN